LAYQQNITIYFDECDPGGIVFFGNYYRLAHRVFEDFIRSLEIPWEHWFKNPDWVVPLRKSQAEYLRPLFAGHTYVVEVKVQRVGESSASFEFSIFDEEGGLCSRVETTHVFADPKKKAKIKIPADIRKKLASQTASPDGR
jgi:acyl-CoA thioester hydrolase/1,4-dihydroxy-2-naphthoyl-CoA hydrolase